MFAIITCKQTERGGFYLDQGQFTGSVTKNTSNVHTTIHTKVLVYYTRYHYSIIKGCEGRTKAGQGHITC